MKRSCIATFIAATTLLQAGCGLVTPRPVLGPVRLVEAPRPEIPKEVYVCRDAPAEPADYFDALDHAAWIAEVWFVLLDCKGKLKAAGEIERGRHATE